MIQLLLAAKRLVHYTQRKRKIALPNSLLLKLQRKYHTILNEALSEIELLPEPESKATRGLKKKHPALNLYQRFVEHKKSILAFTTDFNVSFDNNQAERDIRMAKLKQKVSGTFRGKDNGNWFARIRSYINTASKNNINILDALLGVFNADVFIPDTS